VDFEATAWDFEATAWASGTSKQLARPPSLRHRDLERKIEEPAGQPLVDFEATAWDFEATAWASGTSKQLARPPSLRHLTQPRWATATACA
jgi:hypothetical protein